MSDNGHILGKADLLALVNSLAREPITVPGFGTVYIRGLTAEEREQWEAAAKNHLRATMIALAACDEGGKALFTLRDVPALAGLPAAIMLPLFDAAIRLSRVAQGDIDSLEKTSAATPDDSSASDSPPTLAGPVASS